MIKKLVVLFFLSISLDVFAQAGGSPSLLSLSVIPGISFPLGESSTLFNVGGSVSISADYRLPSLPWIHLRAGLDYNSDPLLSIQRSISILSAGIGGGVNLSITPWLVFKSTTSVGYFLGTFEDFSVPSSNPYIGIDAGMFFPIGNFTVGTQVSFKSLFGLYSGLITSLVLSYNLPTERPEPVEVEHKAPIRAQPLEKTPTETEAPEKKLEPPELKIVDFSLSDIFPVFHKYYDKNPLGSVVVCNLLGQPITDVNVSFVIPAYMDGPIPTPSLSTLKSGESKTFDLFGVFRSNILEITEATYVQGEVTIEYKLNGKLQQRQSAVKTARLLDRNAMTWRDARSAAAFVTAKDPAVLGFSKKVSSMVSETDNKEIDPNLRIAIAFHNALSLYGLTYSVDPKSSYESLSMDRLAVDFLQFPRQTLEYKAGDCDDLAILYAALFESVGIDTAFITIPGHIYMAFSLSLSPDDARKTFSYPDELIFRNGKSWIPIEVTERGEFVNAWRAGAKEWRENLKSQQVALYPVSDGWKVYEPVDLPGMVPVVRLPAAERIVDRYMEDIKIFIEWEIAEQVTVLQARIKKSQDALKNMNRLGLLYAKHGLYDLAQTQFVNVIAKEENAAALVNLGNILYLRNQKEKSLQLYQRAYKLETHNSKALLGIARANHDLEDYFQARKAYAELKLVDPYLAQQFSYLDLRGEEATRAADITGVKDLVLWEEE